MSQMRSFQSFLVEKMNKQELESRREDLEQEMARIAQDIQKFKKSNDRDSIEIAQDSYASYKKKLDAVNKQLKQK